MLAMVHTLVNNGANSVWEHNLLDPAQGKSGRRKPLPKDPVHPTKADFIRAKYQVLAFVHRLKDDDSGAALDDINRQLHASVRTEKLETTFRLLALGADPNFCHSEKSNTTPLHIAAKACQAAQVELLVVYGADPGALDTAEKTPVDYAKEGGHPDLADRLVEFQYEVTDRLTHYLCGRKPDHQSGQHFLIPEMADSSLDLSELAKAAKKKLQMLSNELFEALAMDVFDEVDRRETDALWLSAAAAAQQQQQQQSQSSGSAVVIVGDRQCAPFLPVNPEYSATRNQGRQKLARFNAREFTTLIIDILSDARRRQQAALGIVSPPREKAPELPEKPKNESTPRGGATADNKRVSSLISDDEPLYDSVASDEDSFLDLQALLAEQTANQAKSEGALVSGQPSKEPCVTLEEFLELKKALASSDEKVKQLELSNTDMKQEVALLQNMVQSLMRENSRLRTQEQHHQMELASLQNGGEMPAPPGEASAPLPALPPAGSKSPRSAMRPVSMFEPREQRLHPKASKEADAKKGAEYHGSVRHRSPRAESRLQHGGRASTVSLREGSPGPPTQLPTQEHVVRKTEAITKKIQELLVYAQEEKHANFVPCSEKIIHAVENMAAIFPSSMEDEAVRGALRQLRASAHNLHTECRRVTEMVAPPRDPQQVTQRIIQCAYDIAKAAKALVTLFP
ncbi:PREDICTED: ARF GTPase-activating protein GIT2-like isoform X1 [Priapulus caudatus]|uniref:ARF GTPase-activating protein GIT2-like isoform X1 n=1 Tax=Priapulus caudatus TaxID=37621 RepID=A0ABM1ER72_PRICU|nr:PREDICTED: ARF GTPase-activating protein GIT2-like isoform X1 [Priapulus caudatus]